MAMAVSTSQPAAPTGLLANPWVITVVVSMATFMEVLDTSICNVALSHIQGNLSASQDEATWVLTSYLVSTAMVLPLSGWLSTRIGRKNYYMLCVLLFTVSSALCGMATSLSQLVFFRVLQGVGGGGLQPSNQAILVDTFPPAKRGMAMAAYGMSIMVAPILGPTLGGLITDNYSWRWIFYINIPFGILSLFLSNIVIVDPPYLRAQRADLRRRAISVDYIGLSLLAIGLGAFQIVLDKGQQEDWFGSPFIVRLSLLSVVSLVVGIVWELRHPNPIINLRLLKERNFLFCAIVMFGAFGVLFGSTVLLPQMLQTLMGYSATMAGLVMSPAGILTMIEMPIIGILLSRQVDARWLIMTGLVIVAGASFWMSSLTLFVAPTQVVLPRVVQTLGAGLLFVPINAAAYLYIPKDQTNNASGLFNLIRNIGSSVGVALTTTFLQRYTQFHQNMLVGHVTPLNPLVSRVSEQYGQIGGPGSPISSQKAVMAWLYENLQREAQTLSYLDMFQLFAFATLGVVPLVLLMRRSVSKGAPAAAH